MELELYRKNYLENVKSTAATDNDGTVATFVRTTLDDLVANSIIPDYEESYAVGKYGRKNYRVDASAFDDFENSMSLFIADYDGDDDIPTLTKTDANILFEKLNTFVAGCTNGHLEEELEISTPADDLAERLIDLKHVIRKYKFFIITDKSMSDRIIKFDDGSLNELPIEYKIWDINRLHRVLDTGNGHEPIRIDLLEYTSNGLPYIAASEADGILSYLCVIPGAIIADLYDQYGSGLLEGNVRSFLSTKVKVNKNIRKTILGINDDKHMFFSYNNGISATATSIVSDGQFITSIDNLQIVNGGQTTASLSSARYKDKADLNGIFVQMKLTVIADSQRAQELIPKISRASNSQTAVRDSDFFSGHAFNTQMERYSRQLFAPATNGQQYETHWYFERMRGQYNQAMARMTKSEKEKFQRQNPKDQVITATTFAKYRSIWEGKPYNACKGAQKNYVLFADSLTKEWAKNEDQFDEKYYRDTVCVAILYQYIDKLIYNQSWYEKGYKANIAAYTLSYFNYLVQSVASGSEFDLKQIWEKQRRIPDALTSTFVNLTKLIYDYITNENRPILNVTEWTKKEECWTVLKKVPYTLSDEVKAMILSKAEVKQDKNDRRKEHALYSGIEVQSVVVKKGSAYWQSAIDWGTQKKMLSETDISFLKSATKMEQGRIPSEKQCQRILNIEVRLKDEGFN